MKRRILRSPADFEPAEIQKLYSDFDAPIIPHIDCGQMCAPRNPDGKPFCCDICHAVPAAYKSEWNFLQNNTQLWHTWRGDECKNISDPITERARLSVETPESMVLLACKGPTECERQFRALSCRQFPFFPYVTADYRFIGLAYEWEFEGKCWVIENLNVVSAKYRAQFIATFDRLFALFDQVFDDYAQYSDEMRKVFVARKRRIPILHRNGNNYLLSPGSDKMSRMEKPASNHNVKTKTPRLISDETGYIIVLKKTKSVV